MKTAELTGEDLARWVARAEGREVAIRSTGLWARFLEISSSEWQLYAPHENWAQGGPIIERELIEITNQRDFLQDVAPDHVWGSNNYNGYWSGATPLIAAMRCYVASKFGDEVQD